jgi:hypothetical protein
LSASVGPNIFTPFRQCIRIREEATYENVIQQVEYADSADADFTTDVIHMNRDRDYSYANNYFVFIQNLRCILLGLDIL